MCNINAYLIQERFKQLKNVTIPWIQKEYNLSYKEAKEFLTLLQRRGWVKTSPVGIKYPILKNNLNLRKIVREEVG